MCFLLSEKRNYGTFFFFTQNHTFFLILSIFKLCSLQVFFIFQFALCTKYLALLGLISFLKYLLCGVILSVLTFSVYAYICDIRCCICVRIEGYIGSASWFRL